MPRVKKVTPLNEETEVGRAHSMEVRESQCIALAYDLAEQRIREGTASSQEIVHFLRMGSAKEAMERRLDEMDLELKQAKKACLEAEQRAEAFYKDAIASVLSYRSTTAQDIQVEDRHD